MDDVLAPVRISRSGSFKGGHKIANNRGMVYWMGFGGFAMKIHVGMSLKSSWLTGLDTPLKNMGIQPREPLLPCKLTELVRKTAHPEALDSKKSYTHSKME